MANVDWLQFETLAILFIGIYIIFEIIRIACLQMTRAYCPIDTENKLHILGNIFHFVRIVLITAMLVALIFTGIFNRTLITKPHTDLGHDANVKQLEATDTEQLRAKVEQNQTKFLETELEQIEEKSAKDYETFLKNNESPTPEGGQQ